MIKNRLSQNVKATLIILLIAAVFLPHTINARLVWNSIEGDQRAVLILPFEEMAPLYTEKAITDYLTESGYTVDVFRDENVTVDLMKYVLNNYSIIIIKTFKDDYEQEYALLTGEKINPGEIKYEEDIAEGRINLGYYYTYELTEAFFEFYYEDGSLYGKLIYVIAPKSTLILNTLKDKGARTTVGYSKDVSLSWGWCDLIAEYFFRYMSFGYSAGESIKVIRWRLHPTHGQLYSNLAVTLVGDSSFKL